MALLPAGKSSALAGTLLYQRDERFVDWAVARNARKFTQKDGYE